MAKIKLLISLMFMSFLTESHAETCTFTISDRIEFFKKNLEQEMSYFLSLEFEINNSKIKTTDNSSIDITLNDNGFDTIIYSYEDRNGLRLQETFICKLKADEVYTISPCTCCGIFLMTPSKNAKRGFVKYENNASKEYIAMSSELDYDTIPKASHTGYIFSSISMNCGFRPNRIFIADYNYMDKKYQYENWSTKSLDEKKALKKEQETHVVYSFNYLFLHEEKLIVTIQSEGNKFLVKLER